MFNFRKLAAIGGVCLSVLVAGCLGDGGSSSGTTTTLSGVAMAGPFLSGNVCAYRIANGGQGSQLGCSAIDAATSGYSITFSGYTGDVLVAMEGSAAYDDEATSGDETTGTPLSGTLRSIVNVSADGISVNVALTPLTEAAIRTANTLNRVVVEAAGQQLAQSFGLTASGFDLFATIPKAAPTSGDQAAYRQALRALSQMQSGAGTQYQGKLGDYLGYFAANAGTMQTTVQAAIQTNLPSNCSYANNAISCTVTSVGTGGGSGSGTGNYTLTLSGTASGVAIPAITINNVPKPSDQTAFCGDTSVQSALSSAASGGTLTINSCTFNGTSGSISATLSITTPVALTVPYTVNYTYAANTGGGTTGGSTGSSGTGTTSGSTTAPLASLANGSYYRLVYSAGMGVGIDQRKATARFSSSGAMSDYTAIMYDGSLSTSEAPSLGTASVAELAGDDKVTIGRWNGGTTAGNFYSISPIAITANQGFHYAIGVPPASLPADGTSKCYALTAATHPTIGDGSVAPGSVTPGAQVKIIFGATGKLAINLTFNVGSNTVAIQTPGGMASPVTFGSNGAYYDVTSPAQFGYSAHDSANNAISAYIFLAGANSERLGMSYTRYQSAGGNSASLQGAAYFSETSCQ